MAVYTEVTDEALDAFVAEYDIGEALSLKGIAEGVENSNFLLHTEAGTYILTLYEKRVAAHDLPFFLGLMEHLAGKGFPCPTPIKGKDGNALRELEGRPAAIVTFLDGVWVRRPKVSHCSALGAGLAQMHLDGADFPMTRKNNLSLEGWRELAGQCSGGADDVLPGLKNEIDTELDWLSKNWPSGLPQGVIHADLFPDNVFFIREQLSGFIDFYFACNDLLAYDLAICLNAWCFETDGQFNVTKARALLAGYASVRPLSAEEKDALPLLARGSALRFLLTRLYDWLNHDPAAFVTPKNPREFHKRLRFHQHVRNVREYGID